MQAGFWDRFGISFSGLCAIHCMISPVLVSLLPLWPSIDVFNEYLHLSFIIFIAPAVYLSLKIKRESKRALVYMLVGLTIITLAWLGESFLGEFGEIAVTLMGSLFLIRGHWLNYLSKKKKSYEAA